MNNQENAYDFEIDSDNWTVKTNEHDSLLSKLQNIASFSQLIRMFGAAAIITSMSLFMLQGWAEGNDITRYLKLLAQTGLITGAGLVLSFIIKEVKGARLFFGLSLISVVANFTILGALTYSMAPLDGLLMDYPSAMRWEVINPTVFVPVFLGAVSLLSVVAYFSFSIFARNIAKPLTLSFLVLSALLLVPLRSSIAVAVLASVALWGAWVLIKRLSARESVALTTEAKAALAMLALPGGIIIVRALSLYNVDSIMLLAFSALGFAVLRNIAAMIDEVSLKSRLVDIAQFCLGVHMSFIAVDLLPSGWDVEGLLLSVGIVGFAFDQLMQSDDDVWKLSMMRVTTFLMVSVILLGSAFGWNLNAAIQALIASILILALNIIARRELVGLNASYIMASLAVVVSLLMVLFNLVEFINLGNWVLIGITGGVLIIGASLYERFGLSLSLPKAVADNKLVAE